MAQLCDRDELDKAEQVINAAFNTSGFRMTIGCQVSVAINMILTAMATMTKQDRLNVARFVSATLRTPKPKAPTTH